MNSKGPTYRALDDAKETGYTASLLGSLDLAAARTAYSKGCPSKKPLVPEVL